MAPVVAWSLQVVRAPNEKTRVNSRLLTLTISLERDAAQQQRVTNTRVFSTQSAPPTAAHATAQRPAAKESSFRQITCTPPLRDRGEKAY
jgi:hypothetical protein